MVRAPEDGLPEPAGEVILEFVPVGDLVRVTAMHEPSLTEIVVHGPASAGEAALRRLALRRLAFVLRRRG